MGNVSQVSLWFWSINGNNKLNDEESTWTKMLQVVLRGRDDKGFEICITDLEFESGHAFFVKA